MSLTTVIWSVGGGASLALALVHLFVWLTARDSWANFFFAIAALSAAAFALIELSMMHAETAARYTHLVYWAQLPAGTMIMSLAWFTRFYLKAGRLWLIWPLCAARVWVLLVNFFWQPFREITGLREISTWGETVVVPTGVETTNHLPQVTTILFIVIVIDAAISAWRRGDRRRAAVVGSTFILSAMLAVAMSVMLTNGLLRVPYTISLVFLFIVLGMAFELSFDLVRARKVSMELRQSEERMRLAARAADLTLWEWDVAKDRIWSGPARPERLAKGYFDRIGLAGNLELVHPDDREALQKALREVLETGTDFWQEFRIVRQDGETERTVAIGHLERDESGVPLRLRGVSIDVTERRKTEADLQMGRAELARMQRIQVLDQLSASLAHQIHQPLGSILRNAEAAELFLRKEPPDLEELQAILVDIKEDEQRAASIIEKMRSMMMVREVVFEAVQLDELVMRTVELLNAEFQSHHTRAHLEIHANLPAILGDRIQLQQVILNLLLNALDATEGLPADRRHVFIRGSQKDGMVELSVTDQGKGIPPDVLPRIFEPFFSTKSEGTGIGLALSKTIIDSHDGTMSAENDPDTGATIRVTLPIAERDSLD